MLPISTESSNNFQVKIFSIASQSAVLIIKEGDKLYYRTGLFVSVTPIQITSLHPLIDLFPSLTKLTFNIHFLKINNLDAFVITLFLDTDLKNFPRKNYNEFLKSSLKFHKQQLELLRKNISVKDIESKFLSRNQLSDISFGIVPKSFKKYAYILEYKKEIEIFKNVIFSSNKIKKIDYKRDSIIPTSKIVLGKTISNKDIGINSHVLFLTGKKDFRRILIKSILDHFTKEDNYHIVILDFGLNLSIDKTFFREFAFNDILLDPFSFKDKLLPSQHSIFISHLSFIGKNILRLNDRQIGILEEKLTFYIQQEKNYSWHSFVAFVEDEISEESLNNSLSVGSFTTDAVSEDFTSSLKAVESPLRSNDFESLLNKLRYLDYLFAKADRTSLDEIFLKNHLDIISIPTTPDLKSLFFYLFNLFYSMNESNYKQYVFLFLEIDSILFDKFNDIDVTWIHPDLKNALFDSSDIFSVKKIFNLLETRIYASYISNAPYTLLANSTKENIEKLQFLHDYCLLESPLLQRQEFFKINSATQELLVELPPLNIFLIVIKLLFSSLPEFSYPELFIYFDVRRQVLKHLKKLQYLRKKSRNYILTEKSHQLKKEIIDFLSFQPPLSLEENNLIIKYSDPVKYNLLFNNSFLADFNVESLCTRFLSSQFSNTKNLNGFLLYHFLSYKKHIIDEKKLFYYFLVAIQTKKINITNNKSEFIPDILVLQSDTNEVPSSDHIVEKTEQQDQSKIEIMQNYLSNIKTVLGTDTQLSQKNYENKVNLNDSKETLEFPEQIQELINTINRRINDFLPDKGITFPKYPIFLIMKFLDSNITELIHADITELVNLSSNGVD